MNNFLEGKILFSNYELKIMYKLGIDDQCFCVSLENKNEYKVGQTFYFSKNNIKQL